MNTHQELPLLIITFVIWAIFILYWAISAIGVKRNIQGNSWARSFGIRIILVIIVIYILNASPALRKYLDLHFSYNAEVLGVILLATGIAFAIWARRHLGRNWSGTPSIKEGHELVTSGPYHFLRHPIYTGMILALLGSSLVNGVSWIIAFVIVTIFFLFRIRTEERYMMQLFPDKYPEYKKRTKALVPLVW